MKFVYLVLTLSGEKIYLHSLTNLVQSSLMTIVQDHFEFRANDPKGPDLQQTTRKRSQITVTKITRSFQVVCYRSGPFGSLALNSKWSCTIVIINDWTRFVKWYKYIFSPAIRLFRPISKLDHHAWIYKIVPSLKQCSKVPTHWTVDVFEP